MIAQKFLEEYDYIGERIYLDCATLGLPPKRSLRAAREFLDDFAFSLGEPTQNQGMELRRLCKERLGELIHADPSDIFFTDNTTQGNNLLPMGYPFEAGDEVILGAEDFVSVWMPWTRLQEKGVKLIWVSNPSGVVRAEDYIERITKRTRAIALTWVRSDSGYTVDLKTLGAVCRKRNILLSVDAIQGLGRLPMDVEACHIDVLASASFKGLLGVMGAGFCYCRREVMNRITPPLCSGNVRLCSWELTANPKGMPVPEFREGAARMETGTLNTYGIRIMAESLGLLLELGVEKVQEQVRELEKYYHRRLEESNLDIRLLGSTEEEGFSGTVSFLYPREYREALEAAFKEAGIFVAVREYVRVSFHYYNRKKHVDDLLGVLQEVLPKREEDPCIFTL